MKSQSELEIPKSFFLFFIWAYKPYKIWMLCFIVIALISGAYGTINSYLIKIIIDTLANLSDTEYSVSIISWPIILYVINNEIQNISWRSVSYININTSQNVKSKITEILFRYVQKHSHNYFQNNLSGSVARNIQTLTDTIERVAYFPFLRIIQGVSQLTIAIISMYLINPVFSLILFTWTMVFIVASIWFADGIKVLAGRYSETRSIVGGALTDSIINIINVRNFSNINLEVKLLHDCLKNQKKSFQEKEYFLLKRDFFQGLSITFLAGIMIYFLAVLKTQSKITIGDFAFILTLTAYVADNIRWMVGQFNIVSDAKGQCNNCLQAILSPLEVVDKPNSKSLIIKKGDIEFRNVTFGYNKEQTLFQGLNLYIPSGQKIGLVGQSGSGKTSFVSLILRLFDVQEGEIIIDRQNISNITQDSLRKSISYIPQETSLFQRSIKSNISYGKIDCSDEEVIVAAKKAFAHEFIKKIPQGYTMLVGERGVKLSGGQRQRISIARAIIKNAPILILDEATSHLDSVTESEVQESLHSLMQDKTTIVIAHRPSTLRYVDRLIVLNEGQIVGDGSHEELLSNNKFYNQLWNSHVNGIFT